jgi:PAS domain S-box-containing protein
MKSELTSKSQTSIGDFEIVDPLLHVLDHLPDGILFLDRNWRITYANETARRISRLSPQDLNNRTHWQIYPETVDTHLQRVYFEVMETRRPGRLEAFFYAPFEVWLDVRVLPVPDGIALYYRDVTGTYIAEEARKETAERLQQVLAVTTDGILTLDTEFRITYMNPRAVDMLAPSGNILGKILWDVFPSSVYPGSPYVEHIHRAMEAREPGTFVAYYPAPLDFWVDVTVRASQDGVIIFFRDVSESLRREQDLRASEERYRVLTELSPNSQWMANAQGLVLYANQRFLEYIGPDRAPSTGNEYILCFDPEDRDRVTQTWTRCVTTGEHYSIEARLIRAADGASRWWSLRALPVRDNGGFIQQWLGSAIDIHEERLAADRLREQYVEIDRQRRELETIYHGSPIGMALYDSKDLRVMRINDRQAEILRISADAVIGLRYEDLTAGVPAALALIRRAAAGENVLNQDIQGVLDRSPSERRYWNVNYSPIFDEAGNVTAIAAATVETTAQKRAEAALIQSEKLAAVGRMASSIAHEINNPLEAVTNLIYIARQQANSAEVDQLLDLADQELRRVAIIANQTLRFHKQATHPREITCTDLFATVLSLYEGRLKNSSISVERRKRAKRPIACFEGDIRQILNNLVGNAIDAMSSSTRTRPGRLLLRSRESCDWRTGRRGLTLTVADTGPGISPEARSRIFEAFFTTKGINGTGLGLWISADITARHDGRLLFRGSQSPGKSGTVFSLFLPFEAVLPAPTARPN